MVEQPQLNASEITSSAQGKTPIAKMPDDRKREVVAQLTDDVLAKLTSAFFEVVSKEKWGKRDLALISGLNETAIGHILAGRRKNLTVETIALLARSMLKRPELVLHDTRPKGNRAGLLSSAAGALDRTAFQGGNLIPAVTTIQGSSASIAVTGSSASIAGTIGHIVSTVIVGTTSPDPSTVVAGTVGQVLEMSTGKQGALIQKVGQ